MTTELVSKPPKIQIAAGPTGSPDPISQYRAKDDLFTPSNIISLMRAVMVLPAIMGIIGHLYLLTAAIFVAAFVSDLLDGYIARKYDGVSEFGKIIDPLADKVFVGCVVIAMAAYGLIPVWFLTVILGRDLLIVVVGVWAKKKLGVVLPSNYPGKAAVLSIALTLLFVISSDFTGLSGNAIMLMEWLSVALMSLSLVMYGRRLATIMKATM